MVLRDLSGYWLLFFLSGCASRTAAAATRVVSPDAQVTTPICFVPPGAELGLIERARKLEIQEVCQDAAREQGVSVVPFGSATCLTATMTWATSDTGDGVADCMRTFTGAVCQRSAVHAKSVKLVVARSDTGAAAMETIAVIDSDFGGFSRTSFRALCRAAFHDFPRPLWSAQFRVPVN